LEPIASLEERTCDHLPLREHSTSDLLITLQLRKKNMHLGFFHLIHITKVYKQFCRLIKRHRHITKMLYILRKKIKYQCLMLGRLLIELLLLSLHQPLNLAVELSKPFIERSSSGLNNALPGLHLLLFSLRRSSL
jgi:hypothetical protein